MFSMAQTYLKDEVGRGASYILTMQSKASRPHGPDYRVAFHMKPHLSCEMCDLAQVKVLRGSKMTHFL